MAHRHRHYDASLGRYVQPDPLRVDEKEGGMVGGVRPLALQSKQTLVDAVYQRSGAELFGVAEGVPAASSPKRANLPDGPSIYGYSTHNPLAKIDPKGLLTSGFPFSRPPVQACQEVVRICVGVPGNSAIFPGSVALCEYNCGPYTIQTIPDPEKGCLGFVLF